MSKQLLMPVPDGMRIWADGLWIAGMAFHMEPFSRFADGQQQSIEFEADPGNRNDRNAIRVMGVFREGKESRQRRFHLGFVPKHEAKLLATAALVDLVVPRFRNIWIGDSGTMRVYFDILAPKIAPRSAEIEKLINEQELKARVGKIDFGRCYACGEQIIAEGERSWYEQVVFGTVDCECCEIENHFVTYPKRSYVLGSEFELAPQVKVIREYASLLGGGSSGNSDPGPRNQRQSSCHYCGCEVLKAAGFMLEVASSKGNPMRRTVCFACRKRPQQEWENLAADADREDAIYKGIGIVMGVFILIIILAVAAQK